MLYWNMEDEILKRKRWGLIQNIKRNNIFYDINSKIKFQQSSLLCMCFSKKKEKKKKKEKEKKVETSNIIARAYATWHIS